MRIKNTLRSSAYAIISYVGIAVLTIFARKAFILNLGIEILGYEGLFGNIFVLLSIADLGIYNMIAYRMYPAFAKKDETQITELLAIYRILYKIVGGIIISICVLLIPFLKYIIKDNSYDWKYIYSIFMLQAVATSAGYFFAYKRIILITDLRESECVKVDAFCTATSILLQIFAVIRFRSYVLYLIIRILGNIAANMIVSLKVNFRYPYVKNKNNVSFNQIKEIGLFRDIGQNCIQKICLTIYGGTDNIIISLFLGMQYVGIYSNYLLITSYITTFLNKTLRPLQASIANFNCLSSKENINSLFKMFDLISFFMASFISICYFIMLNPLMSIFFGSKYIFSQSFAFLFSLNAYIGTNQFFMNYYRETFGDYGRDRNYIIMGSIINLAASLFFVNSFGIQGVLIGTVIGHLGFWGGRINTIYTHLLEESMIKYIYRQFSRFSLWCIEMTVIYWGCEQLLENVKDVYMALFLKFAMCISIPNVINILLYRKSEEFDLIRHYCDYLKVILNFRR